MSNVLRSYFTVPRLTQIAIDLAISALAFALAYVLRFEGTVPAKFQSQFLQMLPTVVVIRLMFRQFSGIHTRLWRYVDMRDVLGIVFATALGSLAIWLASRFGFFLRFSLDVPAHVKLPWGVLVHDWWLNIAGYVGVRMARRSAAEKRPIAAAPQKKARILLVGAGQIGNRVATEAVRQLAGVSIVGFVDDDRNKLASRVAGFTVLGSTKDIPRLATEYQVDEVILCIPAVNKGRLYRVLDLCRQCHVKVSVIPELEAAAEGSVPLHQRRELQLEDLLSREPIVLDREAVASYLTDRVVLVTGAGGSIGSEICKQVASLRPSRLLLLGRGEHSIYLIDMALREQFADLEIVPLVIDVRDEASLASVFEEYRPQVVFHAAADKQVPLMERNPSEAVHSNVFGTKVLAELAARFGVDTFVLLSTDKAINPTSVMGASKRVAEMIVQDLSTRSLTRYVSVRFGNVLGSRGSVIPLFRHQIERGGPVTVTHPDVLRYFMTIMEATQLVLEAGGIGKSGELFLLDMGDPMRIVDLARDVIKLCGYEPDDEIKIIFTGLRPGEKLFEELLTAEEGTTATRYKKLFTTGLEAVNPDELRRGLEALRAAAAARDPVRIREGLKQLVKSYQFEPAAPRPS